MTAISMRSGVLLGVFSLVAFSVMSPDADSGTPPDLDPDPSLFDFHPDVPLHYDCEPCDDVGPAPLPFQLNVVSDIHLDPVTTTIHTGVTTHTFANFSSEVTFNYGQSLEYATEESQSLAIGESFSSIDSTELKVELKTSLVTEVGVKATVTNKVTEETIQTQEGKDTLRHESYVSVNVPPCTVAWGGLAYKELNSSGRIDIGTVWSCESPPDPDDGTTVWRFCFFPHTQLASSSATGTRNETMAAGDSSPIANCDDGNEPIYVPYPEWLERPGVRRGVPDITPSPEITDEPAPLRKDDK